MVFGTICRTLRKKNPNLKNKKEAWERSEDQSVWGPPSSNAVLNHIREQKNLVCRSWSCVAPVSLARGRGCAWELCRELGRRSWGRDSLEGGRFCRTCRISAEVPEESLSCRLYLVILSCAALVATAEGSSKYGCGGTHHATSPGGRTSQVGERRGLGSRAGEARTALFAFGSFFWVIVFFSLFFFVVLSQKADRTFRILDAARACVCCFTQRLLPFLASKNAQTYLELLVILPAKWYCFSKFPSSTVIFESVHVWQTRESRNCHQGTNLLWVSSYRITVPFDV